MTLKLLSIDPGTRKTGWAVFEIDPVEGTAKLLCSSVIKVKDKQSGWIERVDSVVAGVLSLIRKHQIDRVVIEQPETFLGSQRGNAASNTGTVAKMMALVFAIRSVVRAIGPEAVQCFLVPVRTWKGNLPKRIVQMRMERLWGIGKRDHNEVDAIGIGSFYVHKRMRIENILAS